MKHDAAIVGAGAAGLAAAIFAARGNSSLRLVLLEGSRKPGAKILVSGGGRCNVTNASVSEKGFFGGDLRAVRQVLAAFGAARAADFFRELGVGLHEEENGKLFPDSNKARTVLDALLAEAARLGVELRADCRVLSVEREGESFRLGTSRGDLEAARVVLATGGLSLPKTGSDGAGYEFARRLGHSIVPTTPALDALLLDGSFHATLSGISQNVKLTVRAEGEKLRRIRGAMLWTHFGVSGPAPMNASRLWHRARLEGRAAEISADFLPGMNAEKNLRELAAQKPGAMLHNALSVMLPQRFAEAVLKHLNMPSRVMAQLRREERMRLARALSALPLPVRGSRGYNYAEATAGGVPLSEVRPATMESRRCPGLYLIGEMLDVDGRIGGFNFQWAWSSGWVAGAALAKGGGRPA